MEVSDPKFVVIYRAMNPPEAHIIRMALEEGGVRVLIEGELLQGIVGELPPWDAAPRILVEQSQVTAAREIIERAHVRDRAKPHKDVSGEGMR